MLEHTPRFTRLTLGLAMLAASGYSQAAVELYHEGETTLSGNLMAVYGMFNSRHNYDGRSGGSHWREGFIKYGLSLNQGLGSAGSLYGTANLVSSATWGDGDAGGFTNGSERTTHFDEAFAG